MTEILDLSLADNTGAWTLDNEGEWKRRVRAEGEPVHDVQATMIERTVGRAPRRPPRSRRPRAVRMRHDAHGYWIEEAGLEGPRAAPAAERGRRRRRRRDRRRLHRPLVELVAQAAGARGAGRPARGRPLRLRPERPQRRLRQLDVLQPADDAGPLRRRAGRRDGPRRRRLGAGDRRLVRGAVGRRLVHPRRLSAGVDRPALRPHAGIPSPPPARSWASAAGSRSSTASETQARCASPLFRAGAFYQAGATVQPARLAAGLRERLLEAGVEIHEHTTVAVAHREGGGVVAETRGGNVRAGAAILGAGGSLLRFRPLRRSLTVTSSHMVITEPVPDVIEELGWTGGECITDSRHMVHYFRTTRDGRIAFGWGGGRIVRGANLHGRAEIDPELAARGRGAHAPLLPAARGPEGDPRVGRADRRLADAPAGDPHRRRAQLRRLRLHRPRRRALADGRVMRLRRWPSIGATSSPRWRSSTRRRCTCRPSRSGSRAGRSSGGRSCARRSAEEEDRVPGRITRMVSGIPERIGIHVGR